MCYRVRGVNVDASGSAKTNDKTDAASVQIPAGPARVRDPACAQGGRGAVARVGSVWETRFWREANLTPMIVAVSVCRSSFGSELHVLVVEFLWSGSTAILRVKAH